jgi:outer membrane cobalamin receptor
MADQVKRGVLHASSLKVFGFTCKEFAFGITLGNMKMFQRFLFLGCVLFTSSSYALNQSSISGTALDSDGISVSDAKVTVFTAQIHQKVKQTVTGAAGDFKTDVHVSSGAEAEVKATLISASAKTTGKEMTITVKAKKNLVSGSAPSSTREVNQEMIQKLPEGDDVKLPKLLATTTPGIIQGPFGQTFIRGNHASIQYQIDGVQLPDSPSNTFGQAFSPRNIDHMEVITGGIPAEYGERLSAVVNIITKSGNETPGGNAEIGYGAYNTLTPQASYSGSTASGTLHYYVSASYNKTDRGLDTPQPVSATDVTHGTSDAVHDDSNGNDEFVKLDWQAGNDDKVSFIVYNSYNYFQIPNFPTSYGPNNPIFNAGYVDQFGNGPLNYVPSNTNDEQAENNAYAQLVWKHTIDPHSFLQLAPYYKFSKIKVTNDPTNDLFAANAGAIAGSNSSSFAEDRNTNNLGLKGDYTNRLNDRNLIKAGFQVQASVSTGPITVISQPQGDAPLSSTDNGTDHGYLESVYLQDDFSITKKLVLNAGIRADATQFRFSDAVSNDSWIEPRIGLSYMATETTKIHAFYGLLYQPAPIENLRDTFINTGAGNELSYYDIKAEKDNYFEVGITQQVQTQVVNLNVYYKRAKNMLDDQQLLNTSIAQPYNFADGYAYGIEFSVNGKITEEWSDYFNYSYEIAKGEGVSGGLFSFPAGYPVPSGYQYLDHVQIHTANAGLIYKRDSWWVTGEGLFGSGLRTGTNNTESLPDHFSADASVGYDFSAASWWSKTKLSFDLLNITNNLYAITVNNGFNGSHYAAGREFFVRLSKEL